MKKLFFISLFVSLASQSIQAQTPEILTIRKFREQNANNIVSEFVKFLSIPDLAKDSTNLLKNANFIMDMMRERGIQNLQLLKGTTTEMPPVVYGEVKVPGAKQTFVFYAHYDGQPVNPTQWAKELTPFDPKLFTDAIDHGGTNIPLPNDNNYNPAWRIYARAASDDKAGVDVILNAYSALKNVGTQPSVNLKFFFEGEEEAGSPHLNEVLEKYSNLLQSDLWIICDGPVFQNGQKQIVFGARGDTHLDLTIYASKRPLHSGHYGNWAPNPAMMMAKLLASMKDESGRVTVKGFYDDVTPLTDAEQKAVREIPSVDEQMKNELGIISTDMKGVSLTEAIMLPSLNINGIQSGNVGKLASNQIPTYATADIDLRLVPGNDWQRQQQKVIDHIKAQGYYVIDHEPSGEERKIHDKIIKVIPEKESYNAQRTPMNLPIAQKIISAVKTTTSDKVVLLPNMGGSLPLYLFEKYLNAKTITVPITNHDNNQHAENENIRLQNLFDGIESMAALMLIK